jgi:putative Holliday junction resolvase
LAKQLPSINLGRVLAIDYGAKRCGIAVTDPGRIIASPLETVDAKQLRNFIKDYISREQVDVIVFGLPVDLQGRDTHATQLVRQEVEVFIRQFPGQSISTIDERFTSKMAADALIAGGMKKKKRQQKGNVDKVSAAIILQSYLEQNS